jgi:hypothetical protein
MSENEEIKQLIIYNYLFDEDAKLYKVVFIARFAPGYSQGFEVPFGMDFKMVKFDSINPWLNYFHSSVVEAMEEMVEKNKLRLLTGAPLR